jgi:hypothetical protein
MFDMSYSMTKTLWEKIDNFIPREFGCVDMDGILIYTLQEMRKYVKRKMIIHCGYEKRKTGYHPLKCACDLHVENMHVIDQFLIASRFDNFNGIGIYPWGLHLDTRLKNKTAYDARWISVKKGEYLSMTADNLKLLSNN